MYGKPGFMLVLWLAGAGAYAGDEPVACSETGHDWYTLPASELRTIAGRCTSRAFADLNYNRAYYRDLLDENAAVSGLIPYSSGESQPNMESFGVYMLLIEQLAPLYFPSVTDRVAFLNAEYDIRNEISELWLHGYGTLAARRSEQHSNNATTR